MRPMVSIVKTSQFESTTMFLLPLRLNLGKIGRLRQIGNAFDIFTVLSRKDVLASLWRRLVKTMPIFFIHI